MSRKFKIIKNYWNEKQNLYKKANIEIYPGITVLVGCNGSGKTTLISQMKRKLDDENIPYVHFDNLFDGGENARQAAGFRDDFAFLTTSIMSSEGENIMMNISTYAKKIGKLISIAINDELQEAWIFFDAVDSGLSIDGIKEIKDFLYNTVIADCNNKEVTVYIVISTNAYEFANGEQCFSVQECKYMTFTNYDDYSKFIMKSREMKDKRDGK